MAKISLNVYDMHCSNCAMHIESLEDELPGIQSITASYQRSQVVVEYDEIKISPESIIQAIKKVGYTAILQIADSS